jgi:hypothetical protein
MSEDTKDQRPSEHWGLYVLRGLQDKAHLFEGGIDHTKNRAKNKAARAARKINRKRAKK